MKTPADTIAATGAPTTSSPTLRKSVIHGAKWTFVGFGLTQLIRFVSNIWLVALLLPEAFGLMGLVGATIQGLAMFSDIGIGLTIIQSKRGDDRNFLDTAWTIQVLRGVLLAGMAIGLAWPMAMFYEQNDPAAEHLRWLLPIVALSVLIEGAQSTKAKTAVRHMKVRATTTIDIASQIVGTALNVSLAWMLQSVYALALGGLLTSVVQFLLCQFALPGPANRFCWDRQCVRELLSFGKWIFLSTVITFFALQLDRFVFAGIFTFSEVGVYSIAVQLSMLTPMLMGRIQSVVVFPLYARLLERKLPISECLRQTKLPMLAIGSYVTAGMIASAAGLFGVAFPDKYQMAGAYVPILAAGAWFAILDGVYGSAFLATGRAKWVAVVNATKVSSFALLLWPCIALGGLTGAVVAVAASDAIKFLVTILLVGRAVGFGDLVRDLRYTLFAAAVGFGVLFLTNHGAERFGISPFAKFVIQVMLVTLAYAPPLLAVARSVIKNR